MSKQMDALQTGRVHIKNMNNQLSVITPKVTIYNDKAVTTSQDVVAYFGKLHKNVIQKIESLECSKEFMTANFSAVVVKVQAGFNERDSKAYEMTKNGFIFLVMGFTGKKAAQFKAAYIAEFDRMEAELNKKSQNNLNFKAIVSVENGNVVSVKELHDDEFVTTIDSIAFIAKKSGYIFMHSDEIIEKLAK